jgi:hypothetical protein
VCGLLFASACWASCGGSSGQQSYLGDHHHPADGGTSDGAEPDTGAPDTGVPDSGPPVACVPTQLQDRPDPSFIDSNCDGIDGMKLGAIFVSPLGDDGNDGSILHPKKTIFEAQAAATTGAEPKDIYLDRGTYNETVTMLAGVSIFGGYDSTAGWTRSRSNVSEIDGAPALRAGPGVMDEVQLVTLKGHVGADGSSYAAIVANATMTFTIDTIRADDGKAGARGLDGQPGMDGFSGMRGIDGSNFIDNEGQGGAGSSTSGCTRGGDGGRGGVGLMAGINGMKGEGQEVIAAGGGAPAPGCGFMAGNGQPGADGVDGAPGGLSPAVPPFATPDGLRLGHGGNGTVGLAGGGGGGGAGGGGALDPNFMMCGALIGGGGGGGGSGGCGGGFGGGGSDGGASFGVYGFNANLFFVDSTVSVGAGGAGGDGGNGGNGGAKGDNSPAGAGFVFSGHGGNGGFGGQGGEGGPGGGGNGGAAACFAISEGSSITSSGTTCNTAATAPGGQGGVSGGLRGNTGFETVPETVFEL